MLQVCLSQFALRLACLIAATGILALANAEGGTVASAAERYTETVQPAAGDTVQFDLVLIPGGTFTMGSPENEPGRSPDEGPQHQVKVSPFYLASTEVTLELFMAYYRETATAKQDFPFPVSETKGPGGNLDVDAVTGPTPVYGDLTLGHGKKNPAMGMTWQNAMSFCRWLSRKTGKTYRLPTEAEWEYACRAGSGTAFGIPDGQPIGDYAWFSENSDRRPHPVGSRKANAWGLFDMAGNVREWVSDFYSPEAYLQAGTGALSVDPKGPEAGKIRSVRGGDHRSPVADLRCANRAFEEKSWRFGDPQMPKSKWWYPSVDQVGIRVARSVE